MYIYVVATLYLSIGGYGWVNQGMTTTTMTTTMRDLY